jgi:hypothetical protein
VIPSNDKLASLALKIAHEVYSGGCIDCGAPGVEMHEIIGRCMRPLLGSTVAILGVTLAPLCQKCHREWEKMASEEQLKRLSRKWVMDYDRNTYQRDQLIALKARAAVCR